MSGNCALYKILHLGIFPVLCFLRGRCNAFLEAHEFMYASFDNSIIIGVDGKNITGLPLYTSWPTVYSVDVPAKAKIISLRIQAKVKQYAFSKPSAILAFMPNTSVVSDSSWKCTTNTPVSSWTLTTFDDSSWGPGPVGDQAFADFIISISGSSPCECDPSAQWLGYYNTKLSSATTFFCRIHLPSDEVTTTEVATTGELGASTTAITTGTLGTIRPRVESPSLLFRIGENNTMISALTDCISNVRSSVSCARICTQQEEFCDGFQFGGSNNLCCPLNTYFVQYGNRLTAVGFNIWHLVSY